MPPPMPLPPLRISDELTENLSDSRSSKKGFIASRIQSFAYDVSIIGIR
jgi:hypothetical protein